MATFIFIDDETTYPTDTEEQIEAAKAAMQEAGVTEAKVWAGDPESEHILNGQILFADPVEAHDATINTTTYRTLARTIAQFLISEGYVQAAIDNNWDPMYYELHGGDLEYLRGQHEDSPAGLPLADEEAQYELECAVEREVRVILSTAVEATQDVRQAIERSASHNEIVPLNYSEERHEALATLASGWTINNDIVEYWAADAGGDDMKWRVHLVRRDETTEGEPECDPALDRTLEHAHERRRSARERREALEKIREDKRRLRGHG